MQYIPHTRCTAGRAFNEKWNWNKHPTIEPVAIHVYCLLFTAHSLYTRIAARTRPQTKYQTHCTEFSSENQKRQHWWFYKRVVSSWRHVRIWRETNDKQKGKFNGKKNLRSDELNRAHAYTSTVAMPVKWPPMDKLWKYCLYILSLSYWSDSKLWISYSFKLNWFELIGSSTHVHRTTGGRKTADSFKWKRKENHRINDGR